MPYRIHALTYLYLVHAVVTTMFHGLDVQCRLTLTAEHAGETTTATAHVAVTTEVEIAEASVGVEMGGYLDKEAVSYPKPLPETLSLSGDSGSKVCVYVCAGRLQVQAAFVSPCAGKIRPHTRCRSCMTSRGHVINFPLMCTFVCAAGLVRGHEASNDTELCPWAGGR